MNQELARLSNLDPREVWKHEARDFTPWILENADVLSEVLGLDLELSAIEHPVGTFALDVIGRDLTNDCELIVENQLTATDHGHLGQLLTYAAGTDAKTIVWMATAFREEHRQALDWLNDLSEGNARFFGVEIGAVQIANSPPAPQFRLRAQPNDWHSQVAVAARSARVASGREAYYLEFWERYLSRVHREHPDWTNAKKPGTWNWFAMPCPFKGGPIYTSAFSSGSKIKTELYIDFTDPLRVEGLYQYLLEHKDEIEADYGTSFSWEELPGRRASRIAEYSTGDVTNVDDYEKYIDWFFDSGQRLRMALLPLSAGWTAN